LLINNGHSPVKKNHSPIVQSREILESKSEKQLAREKEPQQFALLVEPSR